MKYTINWFPSSVPVSKYMYVSGVYIGFLAERSLRFSDQAVGCQRERCCAGPRERIRLAIALPSRMLQDELERG